MNGLDQEIAKVKRLSKNTGVRMNLQIRRAGYLQGLKKAKEIIEANKKAKG